MKRIAVKIGSNVLTKDNGLLDIKRLKHLVKQIAYLHKKGIEVILISSGAVACGRSQIKNPKKLDAVQMRQLFSAVGQASLINHYYQRFKKHNILCGQVLTTKDNFRSREHYLTMRQCVSTMLQNGVIPVLNENDTVSVTELMFTDNDELSGLISKMMRVNTLIILSNVDGVFNGNPNDPNASIIPTIQADQNVREYILATKSNFGRGGMLNKTHIAQKVAANGINVYIANGKRKNILKDLLSCDKTPPCTKIQASNKPQSSLKQWVGDSEPFAKGAIVINNSLKKILTERVVSILPIGVLDLEGPFEKGDIVKILDQNQQILGVGRITANYKTTKECLGKRNQRALVNYDYLHLFL
ncbi:MAG: glutamate 5-kinase [Bacteroidales bacterium]